MTSRTTWALNSGVNFRCLLMFALLSRTIVIQLRYCPNFGSHFTSLPLEFDAGKDAQVDWGEAVVVMAGIEVKVQFFVLRLNYLRVRVVKADPFSKQEAFLDG